MLAVAFAAILLQAAPDDAEVGAAIDRFKTAMKSTSPASRAEAIAELGNLPHAKTAALLVPLLQSDMPPVRVAAAKALGKFSEQKKAVLPSLQHALGANTSDPAVIAAILEALGQIGDPSVMPAVQRLFYEKDMRVVRPAVALAGVLPSATAIDPLIDVMRRQEKYIKANSGAGVTAGGDTNGNNKVVAKPDENAIKAAEELITEIGKSLGQITGESLSGSQQWQNWWNQSRGTFKIKK